MIPKQQVDRGAIKFVLSGAMIMCPGLTSKGAKLNPDTDAGVAVVSELIFFQLYFCSLCFFGNR